MNRKKMSSGALLVALCFGAQGRARASELKRLGAMAEGGPTVQAEDFTGESAGGRAPVVSGTFAPAGGLREDPAAALKPASHSGPAAYAASRGGIDWQETGRVVGANLGFLGVLLAPILGIAVGGLAGAAAATAVFFICAAIWFGNAG